MINAKDFRIGNLLISETGEALPIAYIHDDVIGLHNGFGGVQKHQKQPVFSYNIDKIQLLPLTDEWIINFGLSKENGYPYKFHYGYLKMRNGSFFYYYFNIEIELQFVHQLQNLYFCLTGKELEPVANGS